MVVGEVVVGGEVFVGGGEESGRVRRGQPGDAVARPTCSGTVCEAMVLEFLWNGLGWFLGTFALMRTLSIANYLKV